MGSVEDYDTYSMLAVSTETLIYLLNESPEFVTTTIWIPTIYIIGIIDATMQFIIANGIYSTSVNIVYSVVN